MLVLLNLGHFWCSVLTSISFSSNLDNFEERRNNERKQFFFYMSQKVLKKFKKIKFLKSLKKLNNPEKNIFFKKLEIFNNFFGHKKKIFFSSF